MLNEKPKLCVERLQIHNSKTFKVSSVHLTNFRSVQISPSGTLYTVFVSRIFCIMVDCEYLHVQVCFGYRRLGGPLRAY